MKNYRIYLQEIITPRQQKQSFSFRLISKKAGFGSPNQIQQILNGERNLSALSAQKLADALKITVFERETLLNLVIYEHGSEADKKEALKRLENLRVHAEIDEIKVEKSVFTSNWYVPIIWTFAPFLKDLNKSQEMFLLLRRLVPLNKADSSLQKLVSEGRLNVREDGVYEWNKKLFEIKSKNVVEGLESFYSSCLTVSRSLLRSLPLDRRNVRSTTIAVDFDKVTELNEKIREFHNDILAWAETHQSPNAAIQLNTFMAVFKSDSETLS